MFMNDLPKCVENADIIMYADDDTCVSSSVENVSDVEYELIPDMLQICDWLQTNKFSLNPVKTKFMITGTTQMYIKL